MPDIALLAKRFLSMPFNRHLVIGLLLLGAIALMLDAPEAADEEEALLVVDFFYSPACPYCDMQKPLLDELEYEFPGIRIDRHDVSQAQESRLLLIKLQNASIPETSYGVPATFFGNQIFLGYVSEEVSAPQIRQAIAECLETGCGGEAQIHGSQRQGLEEFEIPFLGTFDLSDLSLPVLAIVLGLVDGFNPCAMWVLVYLISIAMGFPERKKELMLLVGIFVLASGVLYFLFMTAWLNAFLLIGYFRPVTVIVGLIGIGAGILSIKEYFDSGGALVCQVADPLEKKRVSDQLKEALSSPMNLGNIGALILLAFTVNSIEFLCSAAIPAVFTQVLSVSDIGPLEHYGYILLYVLAFMFDDLLVFGLAVFTVTSIASESYAKYCKILGGLILLIIGLLLVFSPGNLA